MLLNNNIGDLEDTRMKDIEISLIRNLEGSFDAKEEFWEDLEKDDIEEEAQVEYFLWLFDDILLKEKRTLSQLERKNHKLKVGESQKRGRRMLKVLI